jgi:hypothetical protein
MATCALHLSRAGCLGPAAAHPTLRILRSADPPLLRKRLLDVRWTQTSVGCSTLACTWGSTRRARPAPPYLFCLSNSFTTCSVTSKAGW